MRRKKRRRRKEGKGSEERRGRRRVRKRRSWEGGCLELSEYLSVIDGQKPKRLIDEILS